MIVLPKGSYRFYVISIKIQNDILHRTRKYSSKIYIKTQKSPQLAKIILRRTNWGFLAP